MRRHDLVGDVGGRKIENSFTEKKKGGAKRRERVEGRRARLEGESSTPSGIASRAKKEGIYGPPRRKTGGQHAGATRSGPGRPQEEEVACRW